ncbi:phytoene/squalene synthase family protein [Streptantibioticus cattleyicolor]|uniref:Putative phytoene synthase n=1 Tax=Streptantibioticus cattleyicolor (strain ATCC 35852 / DSM 46488 / JCM 4925 / NBRC 14057 / NRRL 8057) TaxID=1003195 RepID=F8JMI1_STREN|nr:squalene/phytoene synthase family protein [Streptantibioticus cattleyicolor]AEW99338.1 putative phytoene synthase [Streptantibioticus cattleyicolor NRRL 8057 = DSM 46488]CCB71621.1 putative Phytoene synthase [Streptantibioticus cattleyicolor NRRL 8057 = DSM 46488]
MKRHELGAAGLTDPRLARAYQACADRLRGRNPAAFPTTRCLLPPGKRPYYDALLAFCRHTDDLLDDPTVEVAERERRFDAFAAYLTGLMEAAPDGTAPPYVPSPSPSPGDGEEPPGALIAVAFAHFTRVWRIPAESVSRFLRTIRGDLRVTAYPTYQDLHAYMRDVSGEPAVWINTLLQPAAPAEHSRRMVVALSHGIYLLHFIGDIGEDLRLGRVYLPQEDLGRYGVTRSALATAASTGRPSEPVRLLIRHQAVRVHQLLAASDGWWRLLHPASRQFAHRYHALARDALHDLVRGGYEVPRPASPALATGRAALATARTGAAYAHGLLRPLWAPPAAVTRLT